MNVTIPPPAPSLDKLRGLPPTENALDPSESVFEDESVKGDGNSDSDGPRSDRGSKSGTGGEGSSSDSNKLQLARKETNQVFRLRMLVFLVLLIAAVAVSLIVYKVMSSAEEDDFEQQFASAAEKIKTSFVDIVNVHMSAISSLGVAIIAHGRDHATQTWPYVTLSSFQERATTAREQSGVLYVHINPEVKPSERAQWEIFAANSSDSVWM